MKSLILFLILLSLTSCYINNSSCDEESLARVEKYKCETTNECVNRFDSNYVCKETKNYYKKKLNSDCEVVITPQGQFCKLETPEKQCVKDYCTYENINCGFGTCEIYVEGIGDGGYTCNCAEGYLHKTYQDFTVKCIENNCTDSTYCENTTLEDNDGNEYNNITSFCSEEHKCISR